MTDHTAREALIAEIDQAVSDYRSVFPEPTDLSRNLALAARAAELLRALDAIVAERVAALAEDEAMVERINRSPLDYSTLFAGRAPLEIVAVLRALAATLTERSETDE